jgi:hypothetical protein
VENYKAIKFNAHQDGEFYEIAKKWWNDRGWKETAIHNLSTTGVMIFDNQSPVCAGWLYQTDCAMALVGSVISSLEKKGKKEALKILFKELEEVAKSLGFQTIFFPVTTNSLARLAEKEMSYQNTNQKANELIKFI